MRFTYENQKAQSKHSTPATDDPWNGASFPGNKSDKEKPAVAKYRGAVGVLLAALTTLWQPAISSLTTTEDKDAALGTHSRLSSETGTPGAGASTGLSALGDRLMFDEIHRAQGNFTRLSI